MKEEKQWVEEGIPAFVTVGKINAGKSSVLATLLEIDDNEVIRRSSLAVTTTRCQILPLKLNGEERIRFIDSPGFASSVEAMREIRSIAGDQTPGLAHVRQFVEEQRDGFDYEDECRLLAPILEGAGVLYVVDSSRPVRESAIAEMEILRWTGRARMAVINPRDGAEVTYDKEWKERLGSYFNLTRTFDALNAPFSERARLIRSLVEIDESHRGSIEETVELLNEEWDQRRVKTARVILDFLEEALQLRASETVDAHELESERRKQEIQDKLTKEYRRDLAKLERRKVEKILRIYQHHLLKAETNAKAYESVDLMSEETWSKWGLSRSELTVLGALTGAAGGGAVDIGTGGLTHGLGTLLGGLGGGSLAFLKGAALPGLKLDLDKGLHFSADEGRKISLGPPESANFPFVMLDSILHRYAVVVSRAHGRQDEVSVEIDPEKSFTRDFSGKRRRLLAEWFGAVAKRKATDELTISLEDEMELVLEEIEKG